MKTENIVHRKHKHAEDIRHKYTPAKEIRLSYNIDLPESVDAILEQDFWIQESMNASMLKMVTDPVKFVSNVSIFMRKGSCEADLNLQKLNLKAPCLINISCGQILKPTKISDDFEASFVVISKKMADNVMIFFNDSWLLPAMTMNPCIDLEEQHVADFNNLYYRMGKILRDNDNAHRYQALLFTMLAFIFSTGEKCYKQFKLGKPSKSGMLYEKFFKLVREHFRTERFLDFYADKLGITPKHLSRTIKEQTGASAVEWIERRVVLEAEVLLKSTNMHVQEIADHLHFPSQSFFGKYFKKQTGMSPREFRNCK